MKIYFILIDIMSKPIRMAIFGRFVIIDDQNGNYRGPFLVYKDAKTAIKHIRENHPDYKTEVRDPKAS